MTRAELKQIREGLGFGQAKMSKKLGYSGSYLNGVENGKHRLTEHLAEKIIALRDGKPLPVYDKRFKREPYQKKEIEPRQIIFEHQENQEDMTPVNDDFEIVGVKHVPMVIETPNGFKIHVKGTFKQIWKQVKNL